MKRHGLVVLGGWRRCLGSPSAATLAVLLLLAGCTKIPPADYYLRRAAWQPCADTEAGIRYYVAACADPNLCPEGAVAPPCPSASTVDAVAASVVKRVGENAADVFGTRVLFVPTEIACGGTPVFGCTDVGDNRADVVVTWKRLWWTPTLRHELGHVIRFRVRGNADRRHMDCVFWERLEGRDCGFWEWRQWRD